jgi:hypothetical protein
MGTRVAGIGRDPSPMFPGRYCELAICVAQQIQSEEHRTVLGVQGQDRSDVFRRGSQTELVRGRNADSRRRERIGWRTRSVGDTHRHIAALPEQFRLCGCHSFGNDFL